MKLWAYHRGAAGRSERIRRHDFVIGPLSDSPLFERKARLYYCMRCGWQFLVCGANVAVLDDKGVPLSGIQSSKRFTTFQEGPCPAPCGFACRPKTRASIAKRRPVLRLVTRERKNSEDKG